MEEGRGAPGQVDHHGSQREGVQEARQPQALHCFGRLRGRRRDGGASDEQEK